MTIISVIVFLIIIGVVLSMVPIAEPFRRIIIGLVVIVVVLWLARAFLGVDVPRMR